MRGRGVYSILFGLGGQKDRNVVGEGGYSRKKFGRYVPRGLPNPCASELIFGQKRVLEN